MSTLTKICIVVLAVLVVFASPVFIKQATVGPNWKDAYLAEVKRRQTAEAESANQQMANQVWQRLYDQEKRSAKAYAEQLQSTIDTQKGEIARLSSLTTNLDGRFRNLSASFKALEINLKNEIALNKELTRQLGAQRAKNISLGKELLDAQHRINDYVARNEELTQANQVLRQQAARMKIEVAQLEERVRKLQAGGAKVAEAPVPTGPRIDATVTGVQENVVGLNVGSASGVKKGMKFYIYRGSDFVAYMRVEEVLASSCAGIIEDPRLEVQQGDRATTSLE